LKILSIIGANTGTLIRGSVYLISLLLSPAIEGWAGYASDDSVQSAYVRYIEEIIAELDADASDQLVDYLESVRDTPIELNTATRAELETLPFLTAAEINAILGLRERRGGFDRVENLFDLQGVDRERIFLLQNFIFIGTTEKTRRRLLPRITVRSFLSTEFQERRGYRDGSYLGSPYTTYQRVLVTMTPSHYGGVVIAKSAGERSITERSSGYLTLGFANDRISLTVGDYRLHLGQGVLLWSGFGISKSGNPARGVFRGSTGVRPAASRSDFYQFRGGAVTASMRSTDMILFYSNTPRAATVYDDGSVRTILSYQVYRTQTDREKRNTLSEKLMGFHVSHALSQRMKTGFTWYTLRYNRTFTPDLPMRFSGIRNDHTGIDWVVDFRNIRVFGEAAGKSSLSGIALISGAMVFLTRGVDAALVYRSYPTGYTSMYGFPFSERRGPPDDEQGFYLGTRLRPASRYLVEGYFDLYAFRNKFRSPGFPVYGNDKVLRVEIPVGPVSSLDTRLRRRNRMVSAIESIDGRTERILTNRRQINYRLNFITNPSRSIRIRMQFESVSVTYPPSLKRERGSYIGSDIRWQAATDISVYARYILFGTDSFDSRLYTAEYDMPGRVRTVLLNGHGAILSIGIQWRVFGDVTGSIKYSELLRGDEISIGTGLQQVDGPLLGVVMMQIDARF
jgi:hypothetical protein